MAVKPLKIWIYSSLVLGQHRLVMVADHTVGGAKLRMETHHGTPHSKNGILSTEPNFPDWIGGPGAWVSIVPHVPGDERLRGLDRYSQDFATEPPKIRPVDSGAFIEAETTRHAQDALMTLQRALLAERYPDIAYQGL